MPRSVSCIALMITALALAGCLGGEEPTAGVDTAADGTAQGAPGESAGDGGAPAPEEGADDAPATGGGATLQRESPISWEGALATAACAPSGPYSCTGMSLGDHDSWHDLVLEGAPVRVEATLTWDATTPYTESLGLVLLAWKSCGSNCIESRSIGDVVMGTSPVTLRIDAPELEPGEEGLALAVWHENPLASPAGLPVYAYVQHEQPFSVEGVLVEDVPA